MPTVFRKNGYRFFFYSDEGSEPAHIHVVGKGGELKLWLDLIVISRVYNLKPHEQKEILTLAIENAKLLLEAWSKFHG